MTRKITLHTTDGRTLEAAVDDVDDEVDLDTEPLALPDGRVIDEAGAEDLTAELLEAAGRPLPEHLRRRGRPSLSTTSRAGKAGGASPQVTFRLPDRLRSKAQAEASRRGLTLSQLARQALEEHLR